MDKFLFLHNLFFQNVQNQNGSTELMNEFHSNVCDEFVVISQPKTSQPKPEYVEYVKKAEPTISPTNIAVVTENENENENDELILKSKNLQKQIDLNTGNIPNHKDAKTRIENNNDEHITLMNKLYQKIQSFYKLKDLLNFTSISNDHQILRFIWIISHQ